MSGDSGGSLSAAGEQSLSMSLRGQSDRIWAGLHAHPFLRELARGVLPLEKFRFFIEQDVLYLPEFARCIAMGAAKSVTETELRYFAEQLGGTINLELPNQQLVLHQLSHLAPGHLGAPLATPPPHVTYT